MVRRSSGDEIDADIDLGPERSGFGAFLSGALLALVLCAAGAVAASLIAPLPSDLPLSKRVEIVGEGPAEGAGAAPGETATEGEPIAAAPAGEPASGSAAGGAEVTIVPSTGEPAPAGEPAEVVVPQIGAEPEGTEGTQATASPEDTGTDTGPDVGPDDAGPDPAAGGADEIAPGADMAAAPAAETVAEARPSVPALSANARTFDAPRGAPLLAVVLTGDGVGALDTERLSLLTMPLTVAVSPDHAIAASLGVAAREAGHEVLADLSPTGAGDAGARVAVLETAVGATATDGADDPVALMPVLEEVDRQGMAWVDTGAVISPPTEGIARELGVPYTQGNRVVGGDASPEQIYRAIDSAAHHARQWGTSVLFLDASEPALQALVRWGLEQQGDSLVWFAPISAVIERRAGR